MSYIHLTCDLKNNEYVTVVNGNISAEVKGTKAVGQCDPYISHMPSHIGSPIATS